MKTLRKNTDNWNDNWNKLKKMFKDSWLREKAFKISKTSSFNWVEAPQLPHSSMELLMKSEKFLVLPVWDMLKSWEILEKWKSTQQAMHQTGSRNFNKNRAKENDLIHA